MLLKFSPLLYLGTEVGGLISFDSLDFLLMSIFKNKEQTASLRYVPLSHPHYFISLPPFILPFSFSVIYWSILAFSNSINRRQLVQWPRHTKSFISFNWHNIKWLYVVWKTVKNRGQWQLKQTHNTPTVSSVFAYQSQPYHAQIISSNLHKFVFFLPALLTHQNKVFPARQALPFH